jgi:hypothetical protein
MKHHLLLLPAALSIACHHRVVAAAADDGVAQLTGTLDGFQHGTFSGTATAIYHPDGQKTVLELDGDAVFEGQLRADITGQLEFAGLPTVGSNPSTLSSAVIGVRVLSDGSPSDGWSATYGEGWGEQRPGERLSFTISQVVAHAPRPGSEIPGQDWQVGLSGSLDGTLVGTTPSVDVHLSFRSPSPQDAPQ